MKRTYKKRNGEERTYTYPYTQINIKHSSKEELTQMLLEESFKKGNRINMSEMIELLLEKYKEENK